MTPVARTPSSFPAVTSADAEQLELQEALDLVARFAVSDAGRESVRQRRPSSAVEDIREELAAVAELADLIERGDGFVPEAVPDVRPVLDQLRVDGSVLDGVELSLLGATLLAIRRVGSELRRLQKDGPRIAILAVDPPPSDLGERLQTSLEPDGSVRDSASSELARARREVRSGRDRLVKRLEELIRQSSSHIATADAGVTMRGGRYVIPVRRESGGRVKGIVHGESGSGATLFVEPQEAVPLGNALAAAEAAEARAVIQVLRDLTDTVRPYVAVIAEGWAMCVRIDDLYARSRYAHENDARVPAIMAAPGPIVIREGRHPLLLAELDTVVPFDLETAEGEAVVLVSGPNTGGKTVLLKAIGLITSLTQSGVIPPVGEGTKLPIFTRILADIGDHQSIAANLSTFSAHLEALKGMLDLADETVLVLVDEFGTGTDPSEGAALAGAALMALAERNVLTVATTHLNQLKQLAAATPGAVNASLQFDAERLAPTYRIVKGVPGRSYGLAIARRLGFPDDVMAVAEGLQPETERSFEALLADLEMREQQLEEREREVQADEECAAAERDGLARMSTELADRSQALEEEAGRIEATGREEARRFLLDARKRVEDALGLARAAVTEATAKEGRRLVEDGVRGEAAALQRLRDAATKKGWSVAQSGRPIEPDQPRKAAARDKQQRPSASRTPVEVTLPTEIDLRGMVAEDAEQALMRAVDDAVVADVASLRIIHGKGTGALRERVTTVLRRDKRVASFRNPPPQEGGWGVTIVELNR